MASPSIIVFLLSCFPFIPLSSTKSGFILTSPKIINAGNTENFALALFDVQNNGNITLSLRKKITDDVIAQSVVSTSNKSKLSIEMAIPLILDTEANLQVEGEFPGSSYRIHEKKLVKIRQNSIVTFVQTDKPIYKPGQTVRFRVLPVDTQLKPVNENTLADIWIEDPGAVRIAQWKNVNFSLGILQLELPLSEEPVLGEWSIKTSINHISHTQKFSVEEYVLPKFEVTITPPTYIMTDSETINIQICAQYTYGKKVDGFLNATITYRKTWFDRKSPSLPSFSYEGKISGCHTFLVKPADIDLKNTVPFNTRRYFNRQSLGEIIIYAEVTEDGTEITQNASIAVTPTDTPLKMVFLSVEKGNRYFKPGMPFYGKLLVSKPDGIPAASEEIKICATSEPDEKASNRRFCKDFTTGRNGEINFKIPPQASTFHTIDLKATAKRYEGQEYGVTKVRQPTAEVTLKAWFSPSGSYLQIEPITKVLKCQQVEDVKIRYTTTNGSTTKFYHQVISRGRIVQQEMHYHTFHSPENGRGNINDPLALKSVGDEPENSVYPQIGEFTLPFDSLATMAPIARLLMFYVRTDGEVVADSREFQVTPCFQNQPSLSFRNQQQYPSSEAIIHLSAKPSSLCGVGFVDKSVHLMRPDKQINKEKVFRQMKNYDVGASTQPIQTSEDHEYCTRPGIRILDSAEDRYTTPYSSDYGYFSFRYKTKHVDAIAAFEDAGMVVMSDFVLQTRPCNRHKEFFFTEVAYTLNFDFGIPFTATETDRSGTYGPKTETGVIELKPKREKEPQSIAEIRSYFPETWLWELHAVGENGEIALKRNLPDTVTEWVGSAICVHPDTGFGISDPARITAFQPFFVSFTLPYSVVRNEVIPVVITVFNYLTECLPIKLVLEPSEAFQIVRESRNHTMCVCGGKSKTHKFYIRPVALGNVNITVYGFSFADDTICENEVTAIVTTRDAVTRPLLVEAEGFPKEKVKNSFFCLNQGNETFSTEVDLFLPENVVEGSARAFLSLTGDLMAPALNKLDKLVQLPTGCGEQNMVRFVPNIFVLDYLTAAGRITEDIESKAISHMKTGYQRELKYRHSDGSYSAFGESDNEGSMWLTSFVVRSFSQARRFISIDEKDLTFSTKWIEQNQLENGCFRRVGKVLHSDMKGGLSRGDESLAPLTAYVLTALLEAGYPNKDVVRNAMRCLQEDTTPSTYSLALYAYATALAKDTAAQAHLEALESRAIKEGSVMYWKYEETSSKSIDVEISAYTVLAMLEIGGSSSVHKVLPIVRWIAEQRNPNGGFVSTQDTVVALQALAKYAGYTTSSHVNIGATVESDKLNQSFKIDQSNKLTMQSVKFPVVPTVVDFQASGEGCALAQFTLRYNVESVPKSQAFDLMVTPSVNGSDDCTEAIIGICMRYNAPGKKSNMAVATVKMVSGYVPDKQSLQEIQKDKKLRLKRHDVSENMVHFYFDELTNTQKCFEFLVKNELAVENAKPATVKLYDYYQTELEVTENYEIPSSCSLSIQLLQDIQATKNANVEQVAQPNITNIDDFSG